MRAFKKYTMMKYTQYNLSGYIKVSIIIIAKTVGMFTTLLKFIETYYTLYYTEVIYAQVSTFR